MTKWLKKVKFKDLLDSSLSIKELKTNFITRFSNYPILETFVEDLYKVKSLRQLNKVLERIYEFCDYNNIWVE